MDYSEILQKLVTAAYPYGLLYAAKTTEQCSNSVGLVHGGSINWNTSKAGTRFLRFTFNEQDIEVLCNATIRYVKRSHMGFPSESEKVKNKTVHVPYTPELEQIRKDLPCNTLEWFEGRDAVKEGSDKVIMSSSLKLSNPAFDEVQYEVYGDYLVSDSLMYNLKRVFEEKNLQVVCMDYEYVASSKLGDHFLVYFVYNAEHKMDDIENAIKSVNNVEEVYFSNLYW